MSSSLSIISCGNKDEQKTIDKVIEQLKDQTINLTVDVTIESVKDAIKENSDFKEKFNDPEIKIESFEFKKDDIKVQSTFQDNEEYEVILKIKKEDSKQEKPLEGRVNFKIKITYLNDQQKLDTVVDLLNAINEQEVTIETINLSNNVEIKKAILNLQVYQEAVKDVSLEGSLTLKDHADTVVSVVKDGDVISVEGKIKSVSKEKDFKFTVKVKELINQDQQKLDAAQNRVLKTAGQLSQWLDDETITLASADLTVEKLKTAIKNLEDYQNAFEDGIILKQDLLISKEDGSKVTTIADGDVITVEGTVKVDTG